MQRRTLLRTIRTKKEHWKAADRPDTVPPMSAPAPFFRHFRDTLRLALPIMGMRAGLLVLVTVDTIMVGQFDPVEHGYFALGVSPQIVLMIAGIGLIQGTSVLISQAIGAGTPREAGPILAVAILHALVIGTAFALVSLLAEPFFLLIGQPADVAREAARVTYMFAPGLPAMMLFSTGSYFLESTGHQRIPLYIMIAVNILNAGLDTLLVFGAGPIDPMGAQGAILATTLVRFAMAFAVFGYIFWRIDHEAFGLAGLSFRGLGGLGRRLRKIGIPIFLVNLMEPSARRTILFLAATYGTLQTAAFDLANNLMALSFMMAIGTGVATSIRVGRAVGAGDVANTERAGWAGLALITALAVIPASVSLIAPGAVARIYSNSEALISMATPLLQLSALAIMADCMVGVMLGALRGAGDVWVPGRINIGLLWFVAVPACVAIQVTDALDFKWMVLALGLSYVITLSLLALRWQRIARNPVKRA